MTPGPSRVEADRNGHAPARARARILVVEDHAMTAAQLRAQLGRAGYQVDVATDGEQGLERALSGSYQAAVVDLMLPGRSGLGVVSAIRSAGRALPVLLLTAKTGSAHVVRGLDAGADDYLTKPWAADELLARLRALLRRPQPAESPELALGELVLDRLLRRVRVGARPLHLTPKEFSLLERLLMNPGGPVTRAEILAAWDLAADPSSNLIAVHVARLRAKLRKVAAGVELVAVRNTGFVLRASRGFAGS